MRFKKPKPLHQRKPLRLMDDEYLQLTSGLNAALELVMGDARLGTTVQVELCLARHAWGNWLPYAVKNVGKIPIPDEQRDVLEELISGRGPCPFCGKHAASDPFRILRWHRKCIVRAYARDAIRFGDEAQRQWGFDSLRELELA